MLDGSSIKGGSVGLQVCASSLRSSRSDVSGPMRPPFSESPIAAVQADVVSRSIRIAC